MNRDEARKIALHYYKERLDRDGNQPLMFAPQIGKNEWSTIEFLNSIINDTPLENFPKNPIDSVLKMNDYMGPDAFKQQVISELHDYNKPLYVVAQKMKSGYYDLWYEGGFSTYEEAFDLWNKQKDYTTDLILVY